MNDSNQQDSITMKIKASAGTADSIFVETSKGSDLDSLDSIKTWNHGGRQTPSHSTPTSATPSTLRRAWDDYDAYLFDIDGTLLHCRDAVHYFAFCDALTHAAGRPLNLDGIPVQGKIDPGILRDAFTHAGVPESQWLPQLPALLERMGSHVEAHSADFDIDVLPGVRETLAHLQQRGKLLGVGTGNLQRIGWAKTTRCGLRPFFSFGGFSDSYQTRGPMIAAAVATARATLGNSAAAVLVLGDTPGDIAAARFAGVDVLAVATGIFSEDHLRDADLVVSSLLTLVPRQ